MNRIDDDNSISRRNNYLHKRLKKIFSTKRMACLSVIACVTIIGILLFTMKDYKNGKNATTTSNIDINTSRQSIIITSYPPEITNIWKNITTTTHQPIVVKKNIENDTLVSKNTSPTTITTTSNTPEIIYPSMIITSPPPPDETNIWKNITTTHQPYDNNTKNTSHTTTHRPEIIYLSIITPKNERNILKNITTTHQPIVINKNIQNDTNPPIIIKESVIYPRSKNNFICFDNENATSYENYINELDTKFRNISYDDYNSKLYVVCNTTTMNYLASSDYESCKKINSWGYGIRRPCVFLTYYNDDDDKEIHSTFVAISILFKSKQSLIDADCDIKYRHKILHNYQFTIQITNSKCNN